MFFYVLTKAIFCTILQCVKPKGTQMNWKRIITVSAGTLAVIAISVLCTKACSEMKETEAIAVARDEIARAREAIENVDKENKALRDSIAMWRDSTVFYKEGLEDCEKSKKQPAETPVRKQEPVRRPAAPAKPRVQPRDTVYVVCEEVNRGHVTTIDLKNNSRNEDNILVQNAAKNSSNTKITLGEGSVNNGNIVVNNGGEIKFANDNSQAIDSLRVAVDSLKQRSGNSSAATSLIVVKKVKTYRRTR